MSSGKPTRDQADLAEVLELVLDKGIVINADIAVTVGETELLGIELRAAIASFETAAKYGLAFPSGTDMRRVERASGREPLEGEDGEPIDLGIDASSGGSAVEGGDEEDDSDDESDGEVAVATPGAPSRRPTPQNPMGGDDGGGGDGDEGRGDSGGTPPDETEAETEDADGDENADDGSSDAEGSSEAEESTGDEGSTSDQADGESDDNTDDQEES